MKNFLKFFIILSFFFTYSFSLSSQYYKEKYNTVKKLYLGAVMSGERKKEIEYLKKLILYGDKLHIDTLKYKRELNRIDKNVIVSNPVKTTFKLKPKYTIKSITSNSNSIIVTFNKKINTSYISFFEDTVKNNFIDYFDLRGDFEISGIKDIKLKDIEKTQIKQIKKGILRITLTDKVNPKTIYIVHNDKIIIKVLEMPKKEEKKVKLLKPVNKQPLPFDKSDKYDIKSINKIENAIVIEFNHKIDKSYIDFYEEKKRYFYIDGFDIKGRFKGAKEKKIKMEGIDRTVIYQKDNKTLRIYLRDKTNPKTIYIIGKDKLIIKLLDHKTAKTVKQQDLISPYDKVIVIDPGHGGKDAGAVGGKRRYEKNVVLSISKYLEEELQKRGFKVYLTRSRDYFVKLPNRTKFANRKKADMFVSVHANSTRKSRAKIAHGIETYFLSPARSSRAKRVAAIENKGDIKNMGWSSKNSLLTILNQSKITASNKMAIDIQRNMLYHLRQKYGKKAIRDGGVREGPFWVLVGAQMPSVLVEVGYISHPKEGRRIMTNSYQRLIAKGIAKGIESYFIKN